jgi:hypothetical protein
VVSFGLLVYGTAELLLFYCIVLLFAPRLFLHLPLKPAYWKYNVIILWHNSALSDDDNVDLIVCCRQRLSTVIEIPNIIVCFIFILLYIDIYFFFFTFYNADIVKSVNIMFIKLCEYFKHIRSCYAERLYA